MEELALDRHHLRGLLCQPLGHLLGLLCSHKGPSLLSGHAHGSLRVTFACGSGAQAISRAPAPNSEHPHLLAQLADVVQPIDHLLLIHAHHLSRQASADEHLISSQRPTSMHRTGTHQVIPHELDRRVNVSFFQLFCGLGAHPGHVRQLFHVLQRRALEGRILLCCRDRHVCSARHGVKGRTAQIEEAKRTGMHWCTSAWHMSVQHAWVAGRLGRLLRYLMTFVCRCLKSAGN